MKTATKQKILAYIREKKRISAKEIISYFGLNATGIFRHLGSLIKQDLIIKQGKPPRVFYLPTEYNEAPRSKAARYQSEILRSQPTLLRQGYGEFFSPSSPQQATGYSVKENKSHDLSIIQNGFVWNENKNGILPPREVYCQTRDVFQARLDHLLIACLRQFDENLSYLLIAIVGEIGNNSFDHNLGNWRDVPGIYFAVDLSAHEILIADRGQGIFSTIKRVKPLVKNDLEAMRVAFTEKISGRAPEQRGNGLKFVKKIFEQQSWQLNFQSGQALCRIENKITSFVNEKKNIHGIIALIKF